MGLAAVSAVGVVAVSNGVRSALFLVINFFTLAFLYFLLNAELLGIIQVIVYTGAIMVLFLFVVMLLNLGRPDLLIEKFDLKRPIGILFGFMLFAIVLRQVVLPLQASASGTYEMAASQAQGVALGGPEAIGRTLFTTYAWPFEIASVLLLIGIVGSILLAKRRI